MDIKRKDLLRKDMEKKKESGINEERKEIRRSRIGSIKRKRKWWVEYYRVVMNGE